jgi:RND family efflux transporter MFP subunit
MTLRWNLPLAGGLTVVFAAAGLAQEPPAHVRVAEARTGIVAPEHRVLGSLRARDEATLAAREEGALVEVPHREGALVRKGEAIGVIDHRRLDSAILEVEAEILRAGAERAQREAEAALADRDLVALEAALAQNAVAERQVRAARMDVAVARARVRSVEAQVQSLEQKKAVLVLRREDAVVHAPFDGCVVARHVEPGEWIRPGEPILTLISRGTLEAWLDVPERFAEHFVAAPSTAEVLLEPGGRPLVVRSVRKLPRVRPGARTFTLIVDVDDEGGALIPGMSVSARLPLGVARAHLLVPSDAVLRRPAGTSVFVVATREGKAVAEARPVKVLFELPHALAVEGELAPGDRLVVEGNERLRPGQPVIPTASAPTQANGGPSR